MLLRGQLYDKLVDAGVSLSSVSSYGKLGTVRRAVGPHEPTAGRSEAPGTWDWHLKGHPVELSPYAVASSLTPGGGVGTEPKCR